MSDYQVLFNGADAGDDFYDTVATLEVEENADLPGAISLELPVRTTEGDLSWINDARIAPYSNVAVVATAPDGTGQCIFDGYVLSHKVHLPAGVTGSKVTVWGQDATALMSLTEKTKEWSGLSDVDVANQIFQAYGYTPAEDNSRENAPSHTEDTHTLMQRASDTDFLRRLARRTGRWFRVTCKDLPGARTGYFASPDLTAQPVVTIDLNNANARNVELLDFSWDATRPSAVAARQASLTDDDKDGFTADTSASGLRSLDAHDLATFAGRSRTVILTSASDSAELPGRAAGLLREAGWFARCEGAAEVGSINAILRVGNIVQLEGCGSLLSGPYLVWSVRHTISTQAHAMAFVLVRNAMGVRS